MSQLNELVRQAYNTAANNGFHDEKRHVAIDLMLIVTELSEACEADRKQHFADRKSYEADPTKANYEKFMKDSFEAEIAGTLIRIFDLCGSQGIDINFFVNAEMNYNKLRERLHGKTY